MVKVDVTINEEYSGFTNNFIVLALYSTSTDMTGFLSTLREKVDSTVLLDMTEAQ